MKLWEKTYILTMFFLLLILNGCISVLLYDSFYNHLKSVCEEEYRTSQSVGLLMSELVQRGENNRKLELYCRSMEEQQVFLSAGCNGNTFVDCRPDFYKEERPEGVWVGHDGGSRYIQIVNTLPLEDGRQMKFSYTKSLEAFDRMHKRQTWLFAGISILLSGIIGGVLYTSLKKIFYPVNHISHELRTPLTSIQGYAQYLLYGKVTSEDVIHAAGRIAAEGKYMNEIIERLLIMDGIRSGKIHFEQIPVSMLLDTVKEHYPYIETIIETEKIYSDSTLLISLLDNLLENTCRQGKEITLLIKTQQIVIQNRADFPSDQLIKILNENLDMPRKLIKGRGTGVPLCHEIIRLLRGTLRYESTKEGLKVTVGLPKSL